MDSSKARLASGTVPGEDTYHRILRGQRVAHGAEGLDHLIALGLVEAVAGQPDLYRPVDAREARLRMIARTRSDLAGLALMASVAAAEPVPAGVGLGPEHLDGLDVINARLDREVAAARSEILSSHPHVLHRNRQNRAHSRDVAALQRGVTMRTLYPTAACGRTSVRQWVREMSAHGGEYRVLSSPFARGIIIDRKVAFIDNVAVPEESRSQRCVVVRDPAVAGFLATVFDAGWERALGWAARPDGTTVTTPIQRAILRELINDRTQEGAAKALDMSGRTCEKHLAALRQALGVHSTYAALAWWLRSDETDLD